MSYSPQWLLVDDNVGTRKLSWEGTCYFRGDFPYDTMTGGVSYVEFGDGIHSGSVANIGIQITPYVLTPPDDDPQVDWLCDIFYSDDDDLKAHSIISSDTLSASIEVSVSGTVKRYCRYHYHSDDEAMTADELVLYLGGIKHEPLSSAVAEFIDVVEETTIDIKFGGRTEQIVCTPTWPRGNGFTGGWSGSSIMVEAAAIAPKPIMGWAADGDRLYPTGVGYAHRSCPDTIGKIWVEGTYKRELTGRFDEPERNCKEKRTYSYKREYGPSGIGVDVREKVVSFVAGDGEFEFRYGTDGYFFSNTGFAEALEAVAFTDISGVIEVSGDTDITNIDGVAREVGLTSNEYKAIATPEIIYEPDGVTYWPDGVAEIDFNGQTELPIYKDSYEWSETPAEYPVTYNGAAFWAFAHQWDFFVDIPKVEKKLGSFADWHQALQWDSFIEHGDVRITIDDEPDGDDIALLKSDGLTRKNAMVMTLPAAGEVIGTPVQFGEGPQWDAHDCAAYSGEGFLEVVIGDSLDDPNPRITYTEPVPEPTPGGNWVVEVTPDYWFLPAPDYTYTLTIDIDGDVHTMDYQGSVILWDKDDYVGVVVGDTRAEVAQGFADLIAQQVSPADVTAEADGVRVTFRSVGKPIIVSSDNPAFIVVSGNYSSASEPVRFNGGRFARLRWTAMSNITGRETTGAMRLTLGNKVWNVVAEGAEQETIIDLANPDEIIGENTQMQSCITIEKPLQSVREETAEYYDYPDKYYGVGRVMGMEIEFLTNNSSYLLYSIELFRHEDGFADLVVFDQPGPWNTTQKMNDFALRDAGENQHNLAISSIPKALLIVDGVVALEIVAGHLDKTPNGEIYHYYRWPRETGVGYPLADYTAAAAEYAVNGLIKSLTFARGGLGASDPPAADDLLATHALVNNLRGGVYSASQAGVISVPQDLMPRFWRVQLGHADNVPDKIWHKYRGIFYGLAIGKKTVTVNFGQDTITAEVGLVGEYATRALNVLNEYLLSAGGAHLVYDPTTSHLRTRLLHLVYLAKYYSVELRPRHWSRLCL